MAANRLQQILAVKEQEIARVLPRASHLRAAALERNDFRSFIGALDLGPEALGLIAEVKKASPSAGVIAEAFDPVAIARAYESAGAHALSVLTDRDFFQGQLAFLSRIRAEVALPVLRKDFIIHEVQLAEAFDPVAIARAYESAGAHALSVLTDRDFFQGDLAFLSRIRSAVTLPLLRKDFIVHEVQVAEASVAGADAVL